MSVEAEVIALCNRERRKRGRRPLRSSRRLRLAAQSHAEDMAKRNYFSHTTKHGAPWNVRVRRIIGQAYASIGENIAYGQDDPAEVVKAWMESEGHRRNIMSSDFTKMGLGMARRGSTEYWVQDFGG